MVPLSAVVIGCVVATRRAMRVDPIVALRYAEVTNGPPPFLQEGGGLPVQRRAEPTETESSNVGLRQAAGRHRYAQRMLCGGEKESLRGSKEGKRSDH